MTLYVTGRLCNHHVLCTLLSHNPTGCKHFALDFIWGVSLHTLNTHKALLICPSSLRILYDNLAPVQSTNKSLLVKLVCLYLLWKGFQMLFDVAPRHWSQHIMWFLFTQKSLPVFMVDGGRQLLSFSGNYQHPLKCIIKASIFDILTWKRALEKEPQRKAGKGGKINCELEQSRRRSRAVCGIKQ